MQESIKGYTYKGTDAERAYSTRPMKLSRGKIDEILELTFGELREKTNSSVYKFAIEEIVGDTERKLRTVLFPADVTPRHIADLLLRSLRDSVLLVGDRVGNKDASSITADLIQKTISEKRGGSGKESGLSVLRQLDELLGASKNRKRRIIWAYPRDRLDDSQVNKLKLDLLAVMLSEVVAKMYTTSYNDKELPLWYSIIDATPSKGYHYSIELNVTKMLDSSVLLSQVVSAIEALLPPALETTLFVSPYNFGVIDVFFDQQARKSMQATSALGVRHISQMKAGAVVAGIRGVRYIEESRVNLQSCMRESLQLSDGSWVTYYSRAQLLRYCMREKHLERWLQQAKVDYRLDERGFNCFYTESDPRQAIERYGATPEASEVRFEIDYDGMSLADFFLDRRFDSSRLMTNDFAVLMKYLGIGATVTYHSMEFLDLLLGLVPAFDGRHTQSVTDLMSITGILTPMSLSGMSARGESHLSRFSVRQPEAIAREAAVFGLVSENNTVSTSALLGTEDNEMGSRLWTSLPNPTAGPFSSLMTEEDIEAMRGKRIPVRRGADNEIITTATQRPEESKVVAGLVTTGLVTAVGRRPIVPISGRKRITAVPKKTSE